MARETAGQLLRRFRKELIEAEEEYASASYGGQGRFLFVAALHASRMAVETQLANLGEGVF